MDYEALGSSFYVYRGRGGVQPDGRSLLLDGDILFREESGGGARYTSSRGAVLEFGPGDDAAGAGIEPHPLADGSARGMHELLSRLEEQAAFRDADEYRIDRSAGRMAAFYAVDRDGTTVSVERDSTGYAVIDGFHDSMEEAERGRDYDFNPRSGRIYTKSEKARQRMYDAEDRETSPLLSAAFSVRDMVERATGRVPDTSPVASVAADRVEAATGMSLGSLADMASRDGRYGARDLMVPGIEPGMAVSWPDKHEKGGTLRAVVVSNDPENGAGLVPVHSLDESPYGVKLPAEGPFEGMAVAGYERDLRYLAPRNFADLRVEVMPGGSVGQDALARLSGMGPSRQAPGPSGALGRMRAMMGGADGADLEDGGPSLG